jgi:hypothetical protein
VAAYNIPAQFRTPPKRSYAGIPIAREVCGFGCTRTKKRHDSIIQWFDEHLEKSTRFTASKPPYYRKKDAAISWFKDTCARTSRRVRELAFILEQHNVSVRMLKSNRVGYVVYEDEFQLWRSRFLTALAERGGTP